MNKYLKVTLLMAFGVSFLGALGMLDIPLPEGVSSSVVMEEEKNISVVNNCIQERDDIDIYEISRDGRVPIENNEVDIRNNDIEDIINKGVFIGSD